MLSTNPEKVMRDIGGRIKKARLKNGLTQEELGQRLGGKDVPSISYYENGKRRISAIELLEFSEVLETPIIYFFQDAPETQDEMETTLLQWFRSLPKERKPRVFKMLQAIENIEPIVLGQLPDEERIKMNEQRAEYKAKGKKK